MVVKSRSHQFSVSTRTLNDKEICLEELGLYLQENLSEIQENSHSQNLITQPWNQKRFLTTLKQKRERERKKKEQERR